MNFSESKMLIEDAQHKLQEIEKLHANAFRDEASKNLFKMKIKQYLESVFSALDYLAYTIFNEYSAKNVSSERLEGHKSKVYFPIRETEKEFLTLIKRTFPGLIEDYPEIVDIFRKYQPFPARSKWLLHLKVLANGNKHRNLTEQQFQRKVHIEHAETLGGGTLKNVTLINAGNPFGGPFVSFKGSIEQGIVFEDIGQPVVKTLKRIYASAPTIIKDLESIK